MEYGFGGGMFHRGMGGAVRTFDEQYLCYSFAMKEKGHLDDGDKILLPPSALDSLARMQVEYPMLFELKNPVTGKRTHCGVLEFSAEEGRCYIPFWMMEGLFIEEGSILSVKNVSLSKV
jgi:ubiquitin fusion degradation protein 1